MGEDDLAQRLRRAGAQVIERGWLSANNVILVDAHSEATVVDTSYYAHADQTVQLVEHALAGRSLDRIANTHLHSDHCGGNRALQDRFPRARISTPSGFRDAVAPWNEELLSFQDTGQHCPPFQVDHFIHHGDSVSLGPLDWEAHAAPGHDPHALMFYQPQERLLISGDALWERRLAIIFPELTGDDGFEAAHRTLDAIERLGPTWVLPGHGAPFSGVAQAISRSRERLDTYAAQPHRHREHAARALAMFHMLETRTLRREQLEAWMVRTPIFRAALGGGLHSPFLQTHEEAGQMPNARDMTDVAREVIESLVQDLILADKAGQLTLDSSVNRAGEHPRRMLQGWSG
jgi:glyoxylase-like metal-dependent hydrolase (beta-lactamase superfamily II)